MCWVSPSRRQPRALTPAASANCSSSISRTGRPSICGRSSSAERLAFVPPKPAADRGSVRLFTFSLFFHPLDQALRPHVLPVLIDELETGRSRGGLERNAPAQRHLFEGGPERVLPFFVDQDVINAFFVFKRIGHCFLL